MTTLDNAFIKAYTQQSPASAALSGSNADVTSLSNALGGVLDVQAAHTTSLESPTGGSVETVSEEVPAASQDEAVGETAEYTTIEGGRQSSDLPAASGKSGMHEATVKRPEAPSEKENEENQGEVSVAADAKEDLLSSEGAEPTIANDEAIGIGTLAVGSLKSQSAEQGTEGVRSVDLAAMDLAGVNEVPTFLRIEPSHAKPEKGAVSSTPCLEELDLDNLVTEGLIRRIDRTTTQETGELPNARLVPPPHMQTPLEETPGEAESPVTPESSEESLQADELQSSGSDSPAADVSVDQVSAEQAPVVEGSGCTTDSELVDIPDSSASTTMSTDDRTTVEPTMECEESANVEALTDGTLPGDSVQTEPVDDDFVGDDPVAAEATADEAFSEPDRATVVPFRPMLQVDQFAWPSVVERLGAPEIAIVDELADALHEIAKAGRKTLALGGCWRGDGVTTLLLCAAKQLSSKGLRIAVVEGNLADPKLDSSLEVLPEFGWEDVLAGRLPLEEVVIESIGDQDMALLPLRDPMADPSEDELSIFAENLQALQDVYDLVLVDLGPLEGRLTTDSSPVRGFAQLMDAVVLVHNRKEISHNRLARTGRHLQETGIRVEGVVENFVSA